LLNYVSRVYDRQSSSSQPYHLLLRSVRSLAISSHVQSCTHSLSQALKAGKSVELSCQSFSGEATDSCRAESPTLKAVLHNSPCLRFLNITRRCLSPSIIIQSFYITSTICHSTMTWINCPMGYSYTRHRHPTSTIKTSFPFTSSRTFTNFSKLPAELRVKIWRHCLPKPRAIPIFQKHYCEDGHDQRIICYECFKPHPTILAVNHESRNQALKFYVIIHGPHKFCVAFDNERDTIYGMTPQTGYTHGDLSINLFEKPEFECLNRGRGGPPIVENEVRIKSLAVNEADLRSGSARQYLELDELIIVLPSSLGFRWSDIGASSQIPPYILGGRPQPEIGEVQQEFLREMEKCAKKESRKEGSKIRGVKMPVIKVAQWGTLRTEEDFFCVPLTPLSLRKDTF
jgi:2EXR family